MQTTLRIDDAIYREAKVEAAQEGMTLTHFIEEALRLRIGTGKTTTPDPRDLPSFDSGTRLPSGFNLNAEVRKTEAVSDAAFAARSTRSLKAKAGKPQCR